MQQKGIGAALHINGETRAFKDLTSELIRLGVSAIDASQVHITIIDCAETQIPVFSERDQVALNRARAKASSYLATIPYFEIGLQPDEPRLTVFGKRLAISVENHDFIKRMRENVGEIFHEEANINLSNRNFHPHASVGRKSRGAKGAANRLKNTKIPRHLHVVGFDVSEKTFRHLPGRTRSDQKYTNNPHGSSYKS